MTEPETLTVAERALLEHAASVISCRIDGRVVARWMHCHDAALSTIRAADVAKEAAIADSVALLKRAQQAANDRARARAEAHAREIDAALARAEGATATLKCANDLAEEWESMYRAELARAECWNRQAGAEKFWREDKERLLVNTERELRKAECYRVAAESRLAEATALLKECAGERADGTPILTADLVEEVQAFLSAAPSHAAPCVPCAYAFCDEHPAPAAHRPEDEPHFACAVAVGEQVSALNECKALLRECWRLPITTDRARAIFQWFKAQGEDLNEPAAAATAEPTLVERIEEAIRPYAGTSGCWWVVNDLIRAAKEGA